MKTYEDYIQDAQADATSEGYEADQLWDVAAAMLYNPQFKQLARDRFGVADSQLKFFVADDIFGWQVFPNVLYYTDTNKTGAGYV